MWVFSSKSRNIRNQWKTGNTDVGQEQISWEEEGGSNTTASKEEVPADVEKLKGKASHHCELQKADAPSSAFEENGWVDCMEETTVILQTWESGWAAFISVHV